jgi:cyclophilin family peptidyl-prolyl cis-trans isomerase
MFMMKRNPRILFTAVVMVVCTAGVALCASESKKEVATKSRTAAVEEAEIPFKTDMDKVSYVIGTQIGSGLKAQKINVNVAFLVQGIREALSGKEPAISRAEQQKIMMEFQQKQRMKRNAEATKKMGEDNAWKLNLKKPELMTFDSNKDYFWILQTNKGTLKIKLMPDVAPTHVTSTIFLTQKGFYDDLMFHRVIPGFMAQGGCPLGTGRGGPGYKYDGEFDPNVKHDRPYLLSMANAGPGTDGSQFFLTFKATPWLDGKHTIFGEVVEGKDVMKKLEAAGTRSGKPKEKLIITKATIETQQK